MAEQKNIAGGVSGAVAAAPWIVYGVASGFNHWRIAAGGGLILCLVLLLMTQRRGGSIKLMDWTMLVFFALASVLTVGLRASWFPAYNAVIVWSCFAAAAWGSVVIGDPFTTAYAREFAPREAWDQPVFVRLNLLMTLVWCGLMIVNLALASVGVIVGGLVGRVVLGFALPMAVLVCGFIFNGRFPKGYLARAGIEDDSPSATASSA